MLIKNSKAANLDAASNFGLFSGAAKKILEDLR